MRPAEDWLLQGVFSCHTRGVKIIHRLLYKIEKQMFPKRPKQPVFGVKSRKNRVIQIVIFKRTGVQEKIGYVNLCALYSFNRYLTCEV